MNLKHKRRSYFLKLAAVVISYGMGFSGLSGWTAVQGAEQTKVPPQAGEVKQGSPAPVAIADSEIIPRADQTLKSLQKLRLAIGADTILSSVQKDFAAFAEKSNRRRDSEAEAIGKSRSVPQFNEIVRQWTLEQSQLDDWDRAITKQLQVLAAHQKEVDRIIVTWRATQAEVAKKFLFKAVLQRRVEEVLAEAQATRTVLQEQATKLLKLQSEIADSLTALAKVRKDIDLAREEVGRSLFALDTLPLWEALFLPWAQNDIEAQAAASAQRFLDDLREFVQKYTIRIFWHAIFFIAMVASFHALRRGLTPEAVERLGGSSALFILDRPFAASLLLALIAVPVLYPGAVTVILRIAVFPTVISIIRLLPGLLPKVFRSWVYLLVAMYILDFLRYLLPADWLLTRLLLLTIAAGGAVGLGLFLRSRPAELSVSASRERLVVLAVRLMLVAFAVSVVSNVIGNMLLAEIFVAMPIRIAYAAALIATGAHLLMTLSVVALQSGAARCFRSVELYGELIALRCRALIRLAALVFWAAISLHIAGVLGDITSAAADFLQLRWKVGAAEISVHDVAVFFAVLLSAFIFSRMLHFGLTEEILPRVRLPRGAPGAVDVLSRYGVLLLGFFIALAAAGVDFSKVTLVISALGVGIGFGLQNLVNNFVSGLILVFEHPVQVGDTVEVGTVFGDVRKIGFRASVVRTADGADVIVPNSELIGSRVVNWSLSDRLRRISIPVNVAHGTDPSRVIDILLGIARKHPAILTEPAPLAVFDRFADSSLNFTLLCWSFIDAVFIARSELTIAINNAFKEAGVQIPIPQQEVHVHWPDGQGRAVEPAELAKEVSQSKGPEASAFLTGKTHAAKS